MWMLWIRRMSHHLNNSNFVEFNSFAERKQFVILDTRCFGPIATCDRDAVGLRHNRIPQLLNVITSVSSCLIIICPASWLILTTSRKQAVAVPVRPRIIQGFSLASRHDAFQITISIVSSQSSVRQGNRTQIARCVPYNQNANKTFAWFAWGLQGNSAVFLSNY